MAWELIFMLLLLKIPLFYLCGVVWYAVKAEPVVDEAPDDFAAVLEPRSPGPRAGGQGRVVRRLPSFGPARRPAARRAPRMRVAARR